jgi:hypothetical protein
MGKQAVRHAVHSQETTTVEVGYDPEFEALPDRPIKKGLFTKDMDEKLLRYWPNKNHIEVARLLGVSPTTAIKRYRELIKTPAV